MDCWVLGMIERPIEKNEIPGVVLLSIPNRTAATLEHYIAKWVEQKTTIVTDSWAAYKGLERLGYKHEEVNHSENFVDPITKAHTQIIESLWRWVRNKAIP